MENESFLVEFKKYIADPKTRTILLLGVGLFSVTSVLIVLLVINKGTDAKEFTEAQKIDQNPAQKNQILSEIIKNNPKTVVNPTSEAAEVSPESTEGEFEGKSGYVRVDPVTGITERLGSASNPVGIGAAGQPDLNRYN